MQKTQEQQTAGDPDLERAPGGHRTRGIPAQAVEAGGISPGDGVQACP